MHTLPRALHKRCQDILNECSELDNDANLRTIFNTDLYPYRDRLPDAFSKRERVNRVIDYLLGEELCGREPVLAIFLNALSDGRDKAETLHHDLKALAQDIVKALKPEPPQPRRLALIIANDEYEDARWPKLASPVQDAQALKQVLANPEKGHFEVVGDLMNCTSHEVEVKIQDFFLSASSADLLLFYFSGHGIKDSAGRLYLAMKDTVYDRFYAGSVRADLINTVMADSQAAHQILILDCCYSGAFPLGFTPKGRENIDLARSFEGQRLNRVILASSNALQYALEGNRVTALHDEHPSVYTRYLIEGLMGEAQRDLADGISLDSLHKYVRDKVSAETRQLQVPQILTDNSPQDILIAKSKITSSPSSSSFVSGLCKGRNLPWLKDLPPDLQNELCDELYTRRIGAIHALFELWLVSDEPLKGAIYQALRYLTEDNDRRVFAQAEKSVAEIHKIIGRETLKQLYEKSLQVLGMSAWREANELLSKIIEEDPDHKDAVEKRALVRRHIRLDEAMQKMREEAWHEALPLLKALEAETPDFEDVTSKRILVETQIRLNELYEQAQAAIKSRNWIAALEPLTKLAEEAPDFRDVTDKLSKAKNRVKYTTLLKQAHELYQQENWQAVIDIFSQIKVVEPDYDDPEQLLQSAIYQRALANLRGGYAVDLLLRWQGTFPYQIFAVAGITPASSMDAINKASYDVLRDSAQAGRQAWDELRLVSKRLFVDAFLYPLKDPQRCKTFLQRCAQEKCALPLPQQLESEVGEDAPAILLLLNQRDAAREHWETQQRPQSLDGRLAFNLALLHYWNARITTERGDILSATAHWQRAIANWAAVLEDQEFWIAWGQRRQKCYEARVSQSDLVELRKNLEAHIFEQLIGNTTLSLAFQVELAAARALKLAGGLPLPETTSNRMVGGPLMLALLELEPPFAQFIAEASATDVVARLERKMLDWSPEQLRRYYSSLGKAMALLERDQPEAALAQLTQNNALAGPLPDTPDFDRLNPAYTRLPNKTQAFFQDAVAVALPAYLRLGERAIAQAEPNLEIVKAHWQNALKLAQQAQRGEEVRAAIREQALGRMRYIAKTADQDGEDITWCNQTIEIGEAALPFAEDSADLKTMLAQALTFRGVRKANWLDVIGSEQDLRRAYTLNPASARTCHQFSVALEMLANKIEGRDRVGAERLLLEAERVAAEALALHPGHHDLQEQLKDVQAKLYPHAAPAEAQDPFTALRTLLGDTSTRKEEGLAELEQAWRQEPANQQKRERFIAALIKRGEALIAAERYVEAVDSLTPWLEQFPDSTDLQKQADFARIGYKVEDYLRETGLKYRASLWEAHTFTLPFSSDVVPNVEVHFQVQGALVVMSARLPEIAADDEEQVIGNLLYATIHTPSFKCTRDASGRLLLVAEPPVALLRADLLEKMLWMLANFVDINVATLLNSGQLYEHLMLEIRARDVMLPLDWLQDQLYDDPLPALCAAEQIACQTSGRQDYRLVNASSAQPIIATYSQTALHLSITAGPLRDDRAGLCRRMAEINAQMQLCKITLDAQLRVVFTVDLPGVNAETLRQGLAALETYVPYYSAELIA